MKCDVFDGCVVNGIREPILLGFVLDKVAAIRCFLKLKKFIIKKNKKTVFNPITFYLEDDDHREVIFNRESFDFSLQTIKI